MNTHADYTIKAFKRGQLVLHTWHIGKASRDMELSVFRDRIKRGEIDYVEVTNHVEPFGSYRIP